jgi:hypothetical protein
MACGCPTSKKWTYYAYIQLYSELKDGTPAGSAPNLSTKEVSVCSECGVAEFTLTNEERRWFHAN